jgi:hypothetical protein
MGQSARGDGMVSVEKATNRFGKVLGEARKHGPELAKEARAHNAGAQEAQPGTMT